MCKITQLQMCEKTLTMFFSTIPVCLQQLVWKFAYGMACPVRPLYDLEFVLDKQHSIPPIFLPFKVPTKTLFPHGWVHEHNTFWPLFSPNPYRKGNPYVPACTLFSDYLTWSQVGGRFLEHISAKALKKMKTYRRVLQRRFVQQLNSPIHDWNKYMRHIWAFPELLEPENFVTACDIYSKANEFLVETVTRQLSQAQYCSLLTPPVSL